jgi:hypothetical protein
VSCERALSLCDAQLVVYTSRLSSLGLGSVQVIEATLVVAVPPFWPHISIQNVSFVRTK